MIEKKRGATALFLLAAAVLLGFLSYAATEEAKKDSTGYIADTKTEYTVTQYPDLTGQQATFYTISKDDTLIIIDGGWTGNADAVRKVIAQHGNVVDAWILSHPHKDHAGAFNVIFQDPQGITVKEIYDNGFDYDFIRSVGEPYDDISIMETYHALTKDASNVTHLKRGDTLSICGLEFSILNAYDDIVLANVGGEKDYQNNASLLFKVSSEHSSMLFCSDIKYDMDPYLLEHYTDEISCDYVQVGHHGNWSFSEEFYSRTGASVFFLDAPATITENADFPASALKDSLLAQKKTVLDFETTPNTVTLK